MEKRKITIGDYDTAAYGWTLTSWSLTAAEIKTKYVDKPLGDGSWDLSTSMTDGIPRYKDRKLVAVLELSDGTRMERETVIRNMINTLDGLRWDIRPPDDALHHLNGRVSVARNYNDLAHASVTVTVVCDPWKYANTETVVALTATTAKQTVQLFNYGRRAVVPTLTVTGSVLIEYGTSSMAMSDGVYQWPVLLLTPGGHMVTYSGEGTLAISYREAVLE